MEFIEYIPTQQVDRVILYRANKQPVEGTLCITGHHLILSSRQEDKEELWLLHKSVDTVERKNIGTNFMLTLKCKDFQIVKLEFSELEEGNNVANSIEVLSNIENVSMQYAFYNVSNIVILEDGWNAFNIHSEFSRIKRRVSAEWRLSGVNKNFKVCSSYPEWVVVLKCIDDVTLQRAASFRQNNRFPVLTYYHKENSAVLLSCSQPMVGPTGKKSREDEQILNSLLEGSRRRRGYIVDVRSASQIKSDVSKGGGTELDVNYPQWRRASFVIERPPILQESLIKLIDACLDVQASVDRWLSRLDASNWLSHVKDSLTAACEIAQLINNDNSVLIHGTSGEDTELIVTSLVQVILDPDCRSLNGFEALLEREWIQGGFPFATRCCKSAFASSKNKQESPIFLLFLDCVWQIWHQFMISFEFNENFLIILFKHAYSSQFGTFLCDNEMERTQHLIKEKTISLWSYLNSPNILVEYMNEFYNPNPNYLWPSVAPCSIQLWTAVYQPWQVFLNEANEMWANASEIKQQLKVSKSKVVRAKQYVLELAKDAVEKGLIEGWVEDDATEADDDVNVTTPIINHINNINVI